MPAILASMVMGACFFWAGYIHAQRGEHADARKRAYLTVIALALLCVSIAFYWTSP